MRLSPPCGEAHALVLLDMRAGREPAAAIAACRPLAVAVDPQLEKFYAILPDRAEDFPAPSALLETA